MKQARIAVVLLLGVLLVLGLACDGGEVSTSTPTPTTTTTPTVTAYISLIDNLREAGATVVDTGGVIQQPCISVDGKAITVNGSYVQVFEYEDAAAADTEAALISPTGSPINNNGQICFISWIARPHFYKASNLIVLYVGDNQAVRDVLETVLGPQFAGSSKTDWL
ncbi:MAG TPA: hypothetical protein VMX96_10320 [Dehalococcoidia bacterium]|nr:hypothetical protein [Dehalococcoidia bacterium]